MCNPWSHRDPVGFDVAFFLRFWYFSHRDPVGFDVVFSYAFEFSAGGPGILLLTWSNKARQQDGILELATPAYLRFFVLLGNGTLGRRVAPLSSPYAYP